MLSFLSGVLRAPLLHFCLIGMALFAGVKLWQDLQPKEKTALVITAVEQRRAIETWQTEMGRKPTAEDYQALLHQLSGEAILVNEARKLGFDRVDTIVRRRLISNMRFITPDTDKSDEELLKQAFNLGMAKNDIVVQRRLLQRMQYALESAVTVTEQELLHWYEQHQQDYIEPIRFDLQQVFFSRDLRGDQARSDALAALQTLSGHAQKNVTAMGDPFLLGHEFKAVTQEYIQRRLGPSVARLVTEVNANEWLGPVNSTYGEHLIYLPATYPSYTKPFAEVRSPIIAAVYADKEKQAKRLALKRLRAQYQVQYEPLKEVLIR